MPQLNKPFKPILGFSSHNVALLTKQIELQRLTLRTVQAALALELASHVVHCISTAGKVIVYTDSAGWASQLRFYNETILAALSQPEAKLIVKVIMPLDNQSRTTLISPRIPSQAVINHIKTASEHIPDKGLGEALTRLSNTLNQTKTDR